MLEQRLRQGQPLGHYRLLRLLGQGGFAEVYLSEHIHLNTQVAVKVLHTRLAAEDVFAVKREAQTLARLLHPNIVRVLDFGIEEEIPYLVMDYAPNGTLRHALAQGSRVALSTVIAFTRQVAEALQYAHDQRLIHRDIKPENMLLGRTHEVLLSDFGIALVLQSSRSYRAENIAGTIAYMAPEQIQARPCPASDQYALGIVVYEWLCGTRPFQGSYTEIAVKQSMLPAPPLRIFAPQITPAVEQVVLQALNKDPQQRFTSVRAFALALEQAARQSATQAYPTLLPPARAAAPAALSPFASVLTPPQTTQQPRSGGKIVFDPSDRQQQRPRTSRRGFMLAGAVGLLALGACAADVTLNRLSRDKLPLLGQVVQQGGGVLHSTPPQPILSKPHAALVWIVRWSTDGAYIASGSFDGTMLVWSADTGATRLSVRSSVQPAQSDDYPWSIAWSSRSDQRLAVSFVDGTIQVLDASSRERSASLNAPPAGAVALAWSPDERHLAVGGSDSIVRVYALPAWSVVTTYRAHTDTIKALGWSPDGRMLASGSEDTTIRLWEPFSGRTLLIYKGHSDAIASLAWSSDSTRIVSTALDQTAKVWQVSSGTTLYTYNAPIGEARWSHNERIIALCGGDARVYLLEARSGRVETSFPTGVVYSLAWSPDDTRIVTANYDRLAQIWRVA